MQSLTDPNRYIPLTLFRALNYGSVPEMNDNYARDYGYASKPCLRLGKAAW